jgi:hypothetical protein
MTIRIKEIKITILCGCDTMQFDRQVPILQRNLLLPSSGQTSTDLICPEGPSKCWYLSTMLHGVTSMETIISVFIAMKTSNLMNDTDTHTHLYHGLNFNTQSRKKTAIKTPFNGYSHPICLIIFMMQISEIEKVCLSHHRI